MRRKVIQIANSTQLVSLPRKWAVKHGIKKGDELEIVEHQNFLEIKAGDGSVVDRVEVDFDKFSPLTAKCALDVLHKCGYEEIEINYTDKVVFQAIQDRLLQLIGCDVVEQTDKKVVIKDITKGSLETEFDSLLKRVFTITLSMARNGLNSLQSGNYKELSEFALMEATNNKLVNYCHRILSKKGYKDDRKAYLYYVVLWYFESFADDFRDLFLNISSKKNPKVSKEFIDLYKQVFNYFEMFHEVFFKYDKMKLDTLYGNRSKLIKRGEQLCRTRTDDPEILRLLLAIPHNLFDILPTISSISAL
ncbi:hypothetical protein GOV09_06850 [Candidatus Woesearchaeota archaeon]|nr:hypothetical protein [Candidatus Woesearchaeota archaeon]